MEVSITNNWGGKFLKRLKWRRLCKRLPCRSPSNFFSSHIYRNSCVFGCEWILSSIFSRRWSPTKRGHISVICVQSLIKWKTMRTAILTKFLFCFELRTGGFVIGSIDSLLYGAIILVFSLQLFFGVEFIDKKHGEKYLHKLVFLAFILVFGFQLTSTTVCFNSYFSMFHSSSRLCFSLVSSRWDCQCKAETLLVNPKSDSRKVQQKFILIWFMSVVKRSFFSSLSFSYYQFSWQYWQFSKFIVSFVFTRCIAS